MSGIRIIRTGQPLLVRVAEEGNNELVRVLSEGPPGPTGPQGATGPPGSNALANLTDVDVTQKTNASVLYYKASAGKFVADDINTTITLTDGGNF